MFNNFCNSYLKLYLICVLHFALIRNVQGVYYSKPNSVVNIINVNTKLCLSYKNIDYRTRLSECNSKNKRQQWIIPKRGAGYFVNMYDNDVCLYVKPGGTIVTDYCSNNKSFMIDLMSQNKMTISSSEYSSKCLGLFEEDKSLVKDKSVRNTYQIRTNMNACNKSNVYQFWEYKIISENYNSNNGKAPSKTTTTKKATTTKKTTTTTKKTTTTTKKTTTTTKKTTTTTKKTTTTTKKSTTTTTKKTTTTTIKKATTTTTTVVKKSTTSSTTVNKPITTTTIVNKTSIPTQLSLNYTPEYMKETDEAISNPYRGWFHGSVTVDLSDRVDLDCNYIHYFSQVKNQKEGLQYLGVRLSEYRDREITKEGLTALDNILNEYQSRKKYIDPTTQVILRFYYDGGENCKSDENFNPIVPISNSTDTDTDTDTTNTKSKRKFEDEIQTVDNDNFKQLDNGHLYVDIKDFEYINKVYNNDILNDDLKNTSHDPFDFDKNNEIDDNNEVPEDEEETLGVSFYNDDDELKILTLNHDNEIKEGNFELSDEEKQKFINKSKYLNESYLNEYNELVLSEEELKDYIANSIFINDKLNTTDIIGTNMKLKRRNNDNDLIVKYNATKSDLTQFQFHAAKEIIKKSFEICEKKSPTNEHVCSKTKNVEKYCIAKFKPSKTNCTKYDTTEVEPIGNLDLILTHIRQLSPIVNKYKDLIYIYQGTFVGKWGEMHHSHYVDLYNLTRIMDTIDRYFDPSIYLSVRKPCQHRGINNKFKEMRERNYKSIENRMGLFNDGLFFNKDDYGTYNSEEEETDMSKDHGFFKANRELEIEFQNKLCMNVPNGGEGVYNDTVDDDALNIPYSSIPLVIDNPTYYNNFYVSNNHARNIRLSYLNDDYHKSLLKHWGNTTYEFIYDSNWKVNGLEYIGNHLGYRYVLRESFLSHNHLLKITLENVGYAPAYMLFKTKVVLKSSTSNQTIEININSDNRKWSLNGETETFSINLEDYYSKLTNKKYNVYFNVYDPNTELYIKFGNKNEYHDNLGYKIGTLTIS